MEASPPRQSRRQQRWDREMLMATPSTPSSRFASDVMAAVRSQAWVEAVSGVKLPADSSFGEALKDGIALCTLINKIRPGTIAKVEVSKVPFKQMANISSFIQACRTLGVRESSLFETLDLYNERRLPQVARCLFTLSDIVRKTIPDFPGPHLSSPDKPEVDPGVKAIVAISKGHAPPPPWAPEVPSPAAPETPTRHRQPQRSRSPVRTNAACAVTADSSNANTNISPIHVISENSPELPSNLSLPEVAHPNMMATTTSAADEHCLSPAAHAAGQLTYGIYEGGGSATPNATPCRSRMAAATDSESALYTPYNVRLGRVAKLSAMAGEDTSDVGGTAVEDAACDQGGCQTGCGVGEMSSGGVIRGRRPRRELSQEEQVQRRKQALERIDAELEVALWIEGVTGVTFPGKFWSSLKDGVLLCQLLNAIQPGIIPTVNTAHGPFPEMENISAFIAACRTVGVAEHSLFDTQDLHEKRNMEAVLRCMSALGATVKSTLPSFQGPYLGRRWEACSSLNAQGLRNQLGKGPGAAGGIPARGLGPGCHVVKTTTPRNNIQSKTTKAMNPATGEEGVHKKDAGNEADGDVTATVTPAESPSGARHPQVTKSVDAAATADASSPARSLSPSRTRTQGLLARVCASPRRGTETLTPLRRRWRRPRAVTPQRQESRGRGTGAVAADALPPVILEDMPTVPEETCTPEKADGDKQVGVEADAAVAAPAPVAAVCAEEAPSPLQNNCINAEIDEYLKSYSRDVFPDHKAEHVDDDWADVVSQVQAFVESNTGMPWRVKADMYESLRDGWQLGLLANALRPGLVRRVHNSIMPGKHIHNICNFLTACRRMGVATHLIFDVHDLYAQRDLLKVSRTLLALRALAAGPDFCRMGHVSLSAKGEGTLLVSAAAKAAAAVTEGGGMWPVQQAR